MSTHDLIIAGGGVIGSAIAFALRRELDVLCIDSSRDRAGSASLAAGAMRGAFGEVSADKQSPLDQQELAFRVHCARRYSAWLEELSQESGCTIGQGLGTFVVANPGGHADLHNLAAISAALRRFEEPFESVDPERVPGLKPNRKFAAQGALFIPREGWVSGVELMAALEAALARAPRVRRIDGRVRSLMIEHGRAGGVRTEEGGEYFAPKIVLAAGAGIQAILDAAGERAPNLPGLLHGKGVSVVVRSPIVLEYVLRTPNRDFACGTHLVPRGGGHTYVGATNRVGGTPGADEGVTAGEVHNLLHSAMHELNTELRTSVVIDMRFGRRPLAIDRYPLIGPTALAGLWVATGTYRNGVLMAPGIAEWIRDAVLERESFISNPFKPVARGPRLPASSVEELIAGGVRDLVSFVQEPGGFLPYNRTEELQHLLEVLMNIALAEDGRFSELQRDLRQLLERQPLTEIIPQIYYRVHEYMKAEEA